MSNLRKYNIFIFLSMFGRGLIETFPPLILYNYGFGIKDIILYFFFRYFFAIPINCIFIKLLRKISYKVIIFISSITIGVTYYFLYNMNNDIFSIVILSLLTSIYVYSYWTIRNVYMLQVIRKSNVTGGIGSITIINILALMPSVYIGAYIMEKFNLYILIIIVFVINLISIMPLLYIKVDDIYSNGLRKLSDIPLKSKMVMIFDQFKTVILSLFPLYIFIYINKTYTYLGIFNFLIGLASMLVIYIFSKIIKIKHNTYLSFTIVCLSVSFFLKLLVHDQYIFLSLAIIEGIFIKMQELSFGSSVYNLGKDFDYMSYILITENLFNISRMIISFILLFIGDIKLMLFICIVGFLVCSLFKFDIDVKR